MEKSFGSLHWFSSDPNISKEWMNYIFNGVPDCVSKNLVLCSFNFYHGFVYKQGTIDHMHDYFLVPALAILYILVQLSTKFVIISGGHRLIFLI